MFIYFSVIFCSMKSLWEIYATERGTVTIKSPVKLEIMHALRNSERSFEELVKEVGKAKSTVSEHLRKLESEGLVASAEDEKDRRRKIYSSRAIFVGTGDAAKHALSAQVYSGIAAAIDKPFDFMRSLFRAMRFTTESLGIDTEPALHLAGTQIGKEIAKFMTSQEPKKLLREIARFWKSHNLGTLKILKTAPIEIMIRECYECGGMPDVGKTLCALDEGMLESILNEKLGVKSKVAEVECAGTGFKHCRFIIEM